MDLVRIKWKHFMAAFHEGKLVVVLHIMCLLDIILRDLQGSFSVEFLAVAAKMFLVKVNILSNEIFLVKWSLIVAKYQSYSC